MKFDMNDTSELEELRLVHSTLDGDQDAFRALVLFYELPLLKFLYAFLSDWDNAHEIAQETFIAAYYALPRWAPPQVPTISGKEKEDNVASSQYINVSDHPLAPWLYRITTNKALTFLKKQEKSPNIQFFIGHTMPEMPDTDELAFEDRYVIREQLREALRQLSEDDALCIVLRFVLDEPYATIAEKTHMSQEAVRKRIFRGIKVLKSIYKDIEE
jgi:RNA polymerase sigma-70 factor (ECF subfamily)